MSSPLFKSIRNFLFFGILWAFYQLFVTYQVLAPVVIENFHLTGGKIAYLPYQGTYQNITYFMNGLKGDLNRYYATKQVEEESTKVKSFGIYYDNPDTLKNPAEARAIAGFLVQGEDLSNTIFNFKEFVSLNPQYKTQEFKQLDAYGTKLPLFSVFNIISAIWRAYPKLSKYAQDNGLDGLALCSFEIYDYGNHVMTIAFPHGKNSESILYLSGFPLPEYKEASFGKEEKQVKDEL